VTEHDHQINRCEYQARKLGIDIEDIVWLVGCDSVKQIKRYLFVLSFVPKFVRVKLVRFMSDHDVYIPWFVE
jgi:hypothetical protein